MFWLFLFFFFPFLPAGCTIYTAASCSGDVGGRGGSKTTKVKKLGFKQMELNPKVNTWRGKVLRPVPRCLSGAWSSCLSFRRPCKQVRAATHHREVQSLGYFFPRHLCGSLPETDLRTISTKSSYQRSSETKKETTFTWESKWIAEGIKKKKTNRDDNDFSVSICRIYHRHERE